MHTPDNPTHTPITLRSPGDVLAVAGNLLHYPNDTVVAVCFTPDPEHAPTAPPADLDDALRAWTQPGYICLLYTSDAADE